MGLTHEIEHVHEKEFSDLGGWPALDFVNTVSGYLLGNFVEDRFERYDDLVAWAQERELVDEEWAGRLLSRAERFPGKANEILERGRDLRMAIYRIFTAVAAGRTPDRASFDRLNTELAAAMEHARLESSGEGFRWGWRDTGSDLEGALWPVAKSAADLLVSHKLDRVRSCQGDTCGWLFLDMSKNRSRRWCSMSDCGNTAKARRYYHRKVKGEADGG